MEGTSLGIAGAALAACTFLGSFGVTKAAAATPPQASDVFTVTSSTSTPPAAPLVPRPKGPKNGGAHLVFTVDESAQQVGSDRSLRVGGLAGYASASDGIATSGVIAAVNTPDQRSSTVDSRPARGPPTPRRAPPARG